MTTQIMFKIGDKLKKAVQKRARQEGIALSDIFQFAARSYADRKLNIGLTMEEDSWDNYTKKSKIDFAKGLADFKMGRFKQVR